MLAANWVLCARFAAAGWDRKHLGFISSNNGFRIARVLYGLSLIFFGVAHFIDLEDTLSLIPNWLPGHLFWAYFTGCAFVAAGLAVLTGSFARLAAALSALQIASVPVFGMNTYRASRLKSSLPVEQDLLNAALLAGAWMVTDSYRGTRWLAINNR